MAGELARELSQFPFFKLKPRSFRVEIAGLPTRELEKHPVKVWIEADDIAHIIKIAGSARILGTYPHLNVVYLETYASELAPLVSCERVKSVWNDEPVRADGGVVVTQTNPNSFTMASRAYGRTC